MLYNTLNLIITLAVVKCDDTSVTFLSLSQDEGVLFLRVARTEHTYLDLPEALEVKGLSMRPWFLLLINSLVSKEEGRFTLESCESYTFFEKISIGIRRQSKKDYIGLLVQCISSNIMKDVPNQARFDATLQILKRFNSVRRERWARVWLYSLQLIADLVDGKPYLAPEAETFLNTNTLFWLKFSDGGICLAKNQTDTQDGIQIESIVASMILQCGDPNFEFSNGWDNRTLWENAISVTENYLTKRFGFYFGRRR